MGRAPYWVWVLSVGLILPAASRGQTPHNQDVPPGPALAPVDAMARMELSPGFRVELFAAEPEVINPVAMTFDDRGRVWITESIEYPRLEAGAGQDRIKILEDTDGDGRADKTTIFAEGLNIPSGIALGNGGVYVANAPDILFLRDTDGDDRADEREVLFTGFGRDDVHELPSCLTWGPDGWLYGLNGVFNRSTIEHQGTTHAFTCALWRYHPKTRKFEIFCEGTSNPWGLDYDSEGSFFVSACVIDHLWHLAETGYYHRQAGPYPPHTWKLESIVDHKHQKAAYCGLAWYDAPAYPEAYRGRWFMGNIHGSCINSDSIERSGASYHASPQDDFLSAKDAWFMPVVQKVGPDGNLWIVDWYDRYHCYQDARRDPEGIERGRGRIYRIVHGEDSRYQPADIAKETPDDWLDRLRDPNVLLRRQARRLLTEQGALQSELEAMTLDPNEPLKTRLEALWTRVSQGDVPADFLKKVLADNEAPIRAWGVRTIGDSAPGSLLSASDWHRLSSDADVRVRQEVVIAARKQLSPLDAGRIILGLLTKANEDPSGTLERIAWHNFEATLPESESLVLATLQGARSAELSPEFLDRLFRRLLDPPTETTRAMFLALLTDTRTPPAQVARATDALFESARLSEKGRTWGARLATEGFSEEETSTAAPLPLTVARVGLRLLAGMPETNRAKQLLQSPELTDEDRLRLFEALVLARPKATDELLSTLATVLDHVTPESLPALWRVAARLTAPEVGAFVLARYPQLPESARPQAIDLLLSREPWTLLLLDAIQSKSLPRELVGPNQIRLLAVSRSPAVQQKAESIWGRIRKDNHHPRQVVVRRMRLALNESTGDAGAGAAVFVRVCAQCHRLGTNGHEVGPELTRNGTASLDNLATSVFDPNLVIGDDYEARIVLTADGRSLVGLVVEETPNRLVLKIAGGERVALDTSDIDESKTSDASLMPEGLEQQMTEKDFRDLVAYLLQETAKAR